jgi:hypothetical protein
VNMLSALCKCSPPHPHLWYFLAQFCFLVLHSNYHYIIKYASYLFNWCLSPPN